MNRVIKWHKGGAEKKTGKSQRALLAGSEECCELTELFLKSSETWASTGANTASTNVSDTAEPEHQGERQDSEEYEPEQEQNEQEEDEEGWRWMTVRHVFIMEWLTLMIY